MLNNILSLLQLPVYKTIMLFLATIVCVIFNMEAKRANRLGLAAIFYALGTLTFITCLLMAYKIFKS